MSDPNTRSLQTSGKTVEEALASGLSQLGLTREQVEIEIVRSGSRGLLGIGAEDAIVKITPRKSSDDVAPSPPSESLSLQVPIVEEEATAIAAAEEGEDLERKAVRFLGQLLRHMGIRANVVARDGVDLAEEGDPIPLVLDISGKDLGMLIGRRGETLQALQYLTRLVMGSQGYGHRPLVVDVESYRVRRRRQLRQLALRMAERVAYEKQRIVLESMPAAERRIVHIALRDYPHVTTKSIGGGDKRKVTVLPK